MLFADIGQVDHQQVSSLKEKNIKEDSARSWGCGVITDNHLFMIEKGSFLAWQPGCCKVIFIEKIKAGEKADPEILIFPARLLARFTSPVIVIDLK
ncbi:MAG: hypothetical protein KKE17_06450 [Proteobacteria bacterium]|nr:hypothetical protein [Pseudomonadota bacterium]MBU1709628.1 hypothetical protein [Pseudomonadota bacterium]